MVAYLYYFHRQKTADCLQEHRFKFLIIGFALVRFGFWGRLEDSRFVQTFGLTLLSAGCAVFVALTVFDVFSYVPPRRLKGPVLLIGRASYGIYLWHLAVLGLVERQWPSTAGAFSGFALYFAAALVFGFYRRASLRIRCSDCETGFFRDRSLCSRKYVRLRSRSSKANRMPSRPRMARISRMIGRSRRKRRFRLKAGLQYSDFKKRDFEGGVGTRLEWSRAN
jgi:peptidoglycan/LPS O-acetylase OafA/YrhL